MWFEHSIFYQIYTLGFCGAPVENDGKLKNRIERVSHWIPHFQKLGINALYFCPVFQSDRHGYDTRDYSILDCRLGSNEDFQQVCTKLHQAGIRVVLDGVFHHVGRGFWAFQDVQEKKWDSPYKDWFYINFDGDSNYQDGFWYEGWEGHFELVKLNLGNPEVVSYLFQCIRQWVKEFDIDGLRLDVAYCLDQNFLRQLRSFCDHDLGKEEFFLLGEVLFGDYNQIANPQMCHSVTNYECYKGLHSSFNSLNMFEISHSLQRQFGTDPWCIYQGKHFLSFADNHDVSRIASILQEPRHLPLLYGVLFAMPGIPCIYYGSEWGILGRKEDGDPCLRPALQEPEWNSLTDTLASLIAIRKQEDALVHGSYRAALLTNRQLVIARSWEQETVYMGVNLEEQDFTMDPNLLGAGPLTDLMTGEEADTSKAGIIPGFSFFFYKSLS